MHSHDVSLGVSRRLLKDIVSEIAQKVSRPGVGGSGCCLRSGGQGCLLSLCAGISLVG